MNVCVVPLSSPHSHLSVPIDMFTVHDPADPFIVRIVGFIRLTQSDLMWEMLTKHRLSTPIHWVSVSKAVILSDCFTFACIATAGMTINSWGCRLIVEFTNCNAWEREGWDQSSSSNVVIRRHTSYRSVRLPSSRCLALATSARRCRSQSAPVLASHWLSWRSASCSPTTRCCCFT